jgi:ATP-dependent DNA ligase
MTIGAFAPPIPATGAPPWRAPLMGPAPGRARLMRWRIRAGRSAHQRARLSRPFQIPPPRPYLSAMPPPQIFQPCIPTLATKVPAGPDWLDEIKHDGYRVIVWARNVRHDVGADIEH